MGAVTVENIIKQIRRTKTVKEWKQTVTGFKLGFIRHPEYEFWTNNSIHYKAGASCADCHMPYNPGRYTRFGPPGHEPVQADMKHASSAMPRARTGCWERVFAIQDRRGHS